MVTVESVALEGLARFSGYAGFDQCNERLE
jgi:hypothetical protein